MKHRYYKSIVFLVLIHLLFLGLLLTPLLADDTESKDPAAICNKEPEFPQDDLSEKIIPIDIDILETLTDEQRKWYEKFNEGVLFFDGWQDISKAIIEHYELDKRHEIRRFIQRLGVLIGTEWSRNNKIRCINNNMLNEWGDRIKTAIKVEDEAVLTAVLYEINREVEAVLNR